MHIFDEIVNRRGTDSLKYDFAKRYNKHEDAIPMWIADMDFRVPPEVTAAIQKCTGHGIYGYTETKEDYYQSVYDWFADMHGYHVKSDWMVKTPGVVFALGMAIKALTAPGDAIIIQKPLYPPIESTILANSRVAIDNSLVYGNGRYTIDIEDFKRKIAKHNARMFILCNPHNPVGRVWTKEELLAMGRICKKHNCFVVSDEIHCDIVFEGHKHLVFSTLSKEFEDISIICTAPSKTFNLAGLQVANIFIPNNKIRARFKHEITATGYSQLNTIGIAACKAAYKHCRYWHTMLMQYLTNNINFVKNSLAAIPQIKPAPLEGTYLQWLDFSPLGLPHEKLEEKLVNAKVWPSNGMVFGTAGSGFFRVNLACPKAVLETAMERIINEFK